MTEEDYRTIDVVYPLIKVLNKMIGELSTDSTTICQAIPIYRNHKLEMDNVVRHISSELNDTEKILCEAIVDKFKARFEFLLTDKFITGSYLIAGKRDNFYYDFKRELSTSLYNETLTCMTTLLSDMKTMDASTFDVSNADIIFIY